MEPEPLLDAVEDQMRSLIGNANASSVSRLNALAVVHATLVARDRLEAEKSGAIITGTSLHMYGGGEPDVEDVMADRESLKGRGDGEAG